MKKPKKLKKNATKAQIERKRNEIARYKAHKNRKDKTIPSVNNQIDKL